MQTEITINIENNHLSFSVEGKIEICRPLTTLEIQAIHEAAKYDRIQIREEKKGQAALLSFYTIIIFGIVKYGDGLLLNGLL